MIRIHRNRNDTETGRASAAIKTSFINFSRQLRVEQSLSRASSVRRVLHIAIWLTTFHVTPTRHNARIRVRKVKKKEKSYKQPRRKSNIFSREAGKRAVKREHGGRGWKKIKIQVTLYRARICLERPVVCLFCPEPSFSFPRRLQYQTLFICTWQTHWLYFSTNVRARECVPFTCYFFPRLFFPHFSSRQEKGT